MTALAMRGSRFHNGVSRIHGGVSSRICAPLWPQIDPPEETRSPTSPTACTCPTFLAQEWSDVFDNYLGFDWSQRITDHGFWQRVDEIPDHLFWSVRQSLKSQMLHLVRYRVARQHFRNHGTEAHLDRLLKYADPVNPNVLTIGFARRFATYKRATLLFEDLDWLRADHLRRCAAGAVPLRRQGAPRRRAGPGPDPPHHPDRAACRSSRATSCWSRTTTCAWRAGWCPASTCGSTIRSTRSRRAAPPA